MVFEELLGADALRVGLREVGFLDHVGHLEDDTEHDALREAGHRVAAQNDPPRMEEGKTARNTESGPVFSIDPTSGTLYMRYTERSRNVIWKDDKQTNQAIAYLAENLETNPSLVFSHKLEAGQGLIANNVLHNRTSFIDEPNNRRLLYRARFLERVTESNR